MIYRLNLTSKDTSEIAFEVSRFPDGQQDVTITGVRVWIDKSNSDESERKIVEIRHLDNKVEISSRFNNFKDLELIICATKALKGLGFKEISLKIPYLLGARSDRQFVKGGTAYLRDVIAPILNAQNFIFIEVMDVHSDVAAACINNLKVIDNTLLVRFATNNYQYDNKKKSGIMSEDFILVSPDGGSLKKIYKVADAIGYKGEVITCSKSRDEHGKLSKTVAPITFEQLKSEKDFIIIDDICDGGRTFINIANEIKSERKSAKIYLIITHGIFSKGYKELEEYFDGIYCTNSVRSEYVYKGEESSEQGVKPKFLKVLNVF